MSKPNKLFINCEGKLIHGNEKVRWYDIVQYEDKNNDTHNIVVFVDEYLIITLAEMHNIDDKTNIVFAYE